VFPGIHLLNQFTYNVVNSSDYTASDVRQSSEKLDRHNVALAQFELLPRQVPGEIAKIHEKYQSG